MNFPRVSCLDRSAQYAAIAQLVERILGKDEVGSSNLPSSSTKVLETQVSRTFSSFIGENNRAEFCLTTDAPLLGKFLIASGGLLTGFSGPCIVKKKA